MTEGVTLRKEIGERLSDIGKVDILIGIPSYNNAKTIGHVVQAVQGGLAKYFPEKRAVLVNSDGGSTDGTPDIITHTTLDLHSILVSHRVTPPLKFVIPYHGIPGKGSAFRTIFEIANTLEVKACAVVDADLRSITPEWVDLLIRPIIEAGYDYVTPYYLRHKYDGTITNNIVYPLTRALYGKKIRQPIGGDFGLSGKLISFFLAKEGIWGTDVAKFGIDIWMTTTAIAYNFRICQAFLGAKIHDPKEPSADLSAMLHQVIGSIFDLMETYQHIWMAIRGSEPVPIFGFQYEVGVEPIDINLDAMIDKFKLGVRELEGIWELFLNENILDLLKRLAGPQGKNNFFFPDDVWAKIIFDFAAAAHQRVMGKKHLLKSLTPLYLGKVASFVIETWDSSASEVEERIERLCLAFEETKPHLIERWD